MTHWNDWRTSKEHANWTRNRKPKTKHWTQNKHDLAWRTKLKKLSPKRKKLDVVGERPVHKKKNKSQNQTLEELQAWGAALGWQGILEILTGALKVTPSDPTDWQGLSSTPPWNRHDLGQVDHR